MQAPDGFVNGFSANLLRADVDNAPPPPYESVVMNDMVRKFEYVFEMGRLQGLWVGIVTVNFNVLILSVILRKALSFQS